MRWVLLAFSLVACTPLSASAVTVDQVVVLSKSGVSEAVILALTSPEKVLIPALGTTAGMQISGVSLSAAIFVVSWFALPWYGQLASSSYWNLGVLWLVLTILFEFGFGHFVAHKSWADLLDAYNIAKGNLWVVVLVATFLSPWLAAKLKGYT